MPRVCAGGESVWSLGASGSEYLSLSARHTRTATVVMTRRVASVAIASAPTLGGSAMRPRTASSWTSARMGSVRVKAISVNGSATL